MAEPHVLDQSAAIGSLRKLNRSEIYLVVCACFINVANYMDRIGIAAILVEIQEYFSIGDEYGGLLQTSLLLTLTFCAPFFGFCGDRFSRKWLILMCLVIWSIATIFGAFAQTYWMLLLSRIMVGMGQSGFTTITPTIISDLVLKGARTLLLGCFYIGIPVGCGVGYIMSAQVSSWTGSWRYGICVAPILVSIGIVLLFFAKFPIRGEKENFAVETTKSTSILKDFQYLMGVKSFKTITAAFTFVCFIAGALSWWMPKCLYFGFKLLGPDALDKATTAFYFGTIAMVTGFFGLLLGASLSKLLRHRFPSIDPIICGLGMLFATPFAAGCLTSIAISKKATFIFIFLGMLNINLNWAITTDILLYIVMPSRRTVTQGLHMFITHLLGDCISPYVVGYMSEYFAHNFQFTNSSFFLPLEKKLPQDPKAIAQDFHALQMSLFFVIMFAILAAFFFFLTARFVVYDADRALKSNQTNET